jgi:hypothetical protein
MKQRYRLPNNDVDRGNPNRDHRDDDQPNTGPSPHLRTIARALERILALLVKSEGAERRKMSAPDPKRTSPFQRVTETQYDALF